MSDLDRLVELTPPQDTATSALDWAAVEAALELSLPDDYKALVQRYGSGAFDDFIWLLSPGASEHLDLLRQRQVRLDALQALRDDGEPMPYDISALLPWAITDNGDVLYWVVNKELTANQWPVTVNESRGPTWVEFDGAATQCLLSLLTGSFRLTIFPDDFPSTEPGFRRST